MTVFSGSAVRECRSLLLRLPASEERMNTSAVPEAPGVSFQRPASGLAHPGFSEW